ncbi:Elongation factor 1-beta [Geodia barretti]|uniref:Elongation factor 1-beta n=1 Tax=Geodia barretti TaxID=519541 RepID=A0AA35SXS2_GEOBA|nr:Elongation factor 1-beta [Geodia barretti]
MGNITEQIKAVWYSVKMGFGNLKSDAGLESLNSYLQDWSYIEGFVPSQADVAVFQCLAGSPPAKFNHALRWYNHISSYSDPGTESVLFLGFKSPLRSTVQKGELQMDRQLRRTKSDENYCTLFDDDEEDEKMREEMKKEQEAKKKKKNKPPPIAKSNIILDVKPWDDETGEYGEVEKLVRSVEADGLLWGASKLVPLAYGIKKLQISCVVEDDKVGTDFLEEKISAFEDHVQSVDIAAFNKV